MFRRTLISALVLIAFAAPAASQTITARYPSTSGEVSFEVPPAAPANESASQRQRRYEAWRAANPGIDARIAAHAAAVRAQATAYYMPAEATRDWLRTERFAEIVAAAAAVPQAQRDEAREIVATASSLSQAEQFDAAALLLERAIALDPGNAAAAFNMSNILRRQGQTLRAYEMVQRALAFSTPNSVEEALATVALRNRPLLIFDVPNRPVMVWDCAECPEMAVIPGGAFSGLFFDTPYAIGRFEVTFAEWDACARGGGCHSNPNAYHDVARGRRPVTGVSWSDAHEYVEWLSSVTGKRYFLPNDGQWEFAARAGTPTRYHWGDEPNYNYANMGAVDPISGGGVVATSGRDRWTGYAPVGQFPPNAFGLFDVIGNVFEWADGCVQAAPDGICSARSLRGGSHASTWEFATVDRRSPLQGDARSGQVGFRVARALVEAPPAPDPAP